jgi:hypothetical protein
MTPHLQALASAFGAEIDDHLEREEKRTTGPNPTHYTLIKDDPIKHPKHYTSHPSGIEPIEICAYETFYRGNVIKYVMRAPYKGTELHDLKKARQYLDWEISRVEEVGS